MDQHPVDKYVVKFDKIEVSTPKNVQKMAIIQIWHVSEQVVKPWRKYYLRDPIMQDKLHSESPID